MLAIHLHNPFGSVSLFPKVISHATKKITDPKSIRQYTEISSLTKEFLETALDKPKNLFVMKTSSLGEDKVAFRL